MAKPPGWETKGEAHLFHTDSKSEDTNKDGTVDKVEGEAAVAVAKGEIKSGDVRAFGEASFMQAKGSYSDTDHDGTWDTIEGEATAYRAQGGVESDTLGMTLDLAAGYAKGKAGRSVKTVNGIPVGAKGELLGEVAAAKGKFTFWAAGDPIMSCLPGSSLINDIKDLLGMPVLDKQNPALKVEAEGNVLHAEAKSKGFLGYDGRRWGFGGEAGAGAAVADGSVEGTRTIALPFGLTIEMKAKVGGDVLAVGAGAKAEGYYDEQEKRAHVGIGGKLALALGIKADLHLSIGKAYKKPETQ